MLARGDEQLAAWIAARHFAHHPRDPGLHRGEFAGQEKSLNHRLCVEAPTTARISERRSSPRDPKHCSAPAVEQAETQHVHTKEADWRPKDNVGEVGPAAALGHLCGPPGGIAIQLLEIV